MASLIRHISHITCCITIWCVAWLGGGHIWWVPLSILLAIPCIIWRTGDTRTRTLSLSMYRHMWLYLESTIPPIRHIISRNRHTLEEKIAHTGRTMDTHRTSTSYTRVALTLLPPCITPLLLTHHIIYLTLLAVPCIIYATPHIRLYTYTQNRRSACGREAAFFLVYVHIVQTAGVSLYRSFEMLRHAGGAFPVMRRESHIINRHIMTGHTISDSLLHYARHHPLHILRDFVSGYVAKQSVVGDVPSYTAEKARQAFTEYEAAWNRYERSAQEIFGGIMMFAIILPMMIMLSAMLGTPQAVQTLMVSGTLISPLVSLAMILVLGQAQPPSGGGPPVSYVAAIPGCITCIILYVSNMETAVIISGGILAFAISNSVAGRRIVSSISSCDRMLPEFLRDMTEMARTGSGVPQMIRQAAARRSYESHFNHILYEVAGRMNGGMTLNDALSISYPTLNTRFVMFILGIIHRTGGGTPAILETIADYAGRLQQAKESVRKSLSPLCSVVYATPFITLGMAYVMLGIFAGGATTDTELPFSPISGDAITSYISDMGLMATSMSIPMGVVASKISSYTILDTRPLCMVAASNLAALLALPTLLEWTGLV